MSTQKKYSKSKFLKEAKEAYKSILIAEGFLDVLVDLVFGRQIATAGKALANDPEYMDAVKKIKSLEKNLVQIQNQYDKSKKERLDFYFITYGIDLYSLDERSRASELYSIEKRQGKYKNLKPLGRDQQDLNRKLVSKKR
jgi:hypothetical protein